MKSKIKRIKKLKTYIIIAIIIILAIYVGYIVAIKITTKENPNEESINGKLINELHNNMIIGNTDTDLYFVKDKKVENLTYEQVIPYAIAKYVEENNLITKIKNEEDVSISKIEIDKIIIETFDINQKAIKENNYYKYGCWNFNYKKETNKFELDKQTAGFEYENTVKSMLLNSEANNNKIYIYEKVLNCSISSGGICLDRINGKEIVTSIKDYQNIEYDKKIANNKINYDYVFTNYNEKLLTVKTTFAKKKDGKYYWDSQEIVK